jgi:hypothetical protein
MSVQAPVLNIKDVADVVIRRNFQNLKSYFTALLQQSTTTVTTASTTSIVTANSSNYQMLGTEGVLLCPDLGTSPTISLADATLFKSKEIYLVKTTNSTNAVTLAALKTTAAGTSTQQLVGGAISVTMTHNLEVLHLISDGSNWLILNRYHP